MTTKNQVPGQIPDGVASSLLSNVQLVALILDLEGKVSYANPFLIELLGECCETFVGSDWFEACFPEDKRSELKTFIFEDLAAGHDKHFECEMIYADRLHDMFFHQTVVKEDGQVTGVFLLGQDVSSRHRQEAAWRTDQMHLDSVLDTAMDGIIIIDKVGTILSFNATAETLFGYKAEEVLGLNVKVLMPEPHQSRHDEYMSAYMNTGRAKIIGRGREVLGKRKDGSTFPISLNVGREMVLGDKTYFTGFIRDLSKEKRIENQLRQAQKMESIGTLAGGIAHDFNNILGGIMGYVDLMLEDADPGSYLQEDLTEMRNACQRGKDLILQILTFSRQDKTQKIAVQFHPIIKESLKLLRAIIPANIEIRSDLDEGAGSVLADATQIHQIMMNLCTNAYHALRNDGGFISIRLQQVAVDENYRTLTHNLAYGEYLQLSVSDNGHGMDETTLARIFDPFFTTKIQGQGTGMGLAVVHGIVQNHGGEIIVESRPDEGTCFHLFFPVHEENEDVIEEEQAGMPKGRERIMLVDDDKLLLKVQSRILGRRGYTVTTFVNGQDALAAFSDAPTSYELVITDQTMPKLTGIELAGAILELNPRIPIIITTGFSDVITPEGIREKGIRELLRKPVDSEELTQAVRRVLDE